MRLRLCSFRRGCVRGRGWECRGGSVGRRCVLFALVLVYWVGGTNLWLCEVCCLVLYGTSEGVFATITLA